VSLFRGRSGYFVAACQLCNARLQTSAVTREAARTAAVLAGWGERKHARGVSEQLWRGVSEQLWRWRCPDCIARTPREGAPP
jgi:hypothetical protein